MQLKKIICVLLLFMLQMSTVYADSYCVISGKDNTVIDEKNMNEPQSVASISKIMTAIIAIEQGNLKDTWVCGEELKQAYGSLLYLKEGDKVSLQSMLYGLMLRSGNDAALEIAVHIAKSEAAFVKLMNEKAQEIGMLNTEFHNSSGLDEQDGGNISTAYDMALLMSYAMKNETFRTITSTTYYTNESDLRWKNKNRLLFEYPFTNGGKTGYTKKAGRTLVTSAAYQDTESIVVTLKTADDFEFHKEKHQETFSQYDTIVLLKKGTYHCDGRKFKIDQDVCVTVKKDGTTKIETAIHVEKGQLIVEVQKKGHVDVYTYKENKDKKSSLFGSVHL
ncbi:MAG: D-alanyl-D-alanine carboxypeptidase [Longicatena sp.]